MRLLLALAFVLPSIAHAAAMGIDDARHLLSRTGFAPTPAEVREFAALSRDRGVERILAATRSEARTPPPAWVGEPVTPRRAIRDMSPEERQAFQRREIERGLDLRGWWLQEMVTTPAPLTERMTLFWHNHFVSSQQKVRSGQLMYRQNVLLRRHATGNFGALLHAVSKDPAMVIYLDAATNRKGEPNENFAREVMELFTMGEGHYGERDIREAARAFTGWSLDPDTAEFRWRPFQHDTGSKTVLGRSGEFDGDDVLDILLAQPATADFVAAKLWREFVSPAPASDAEKRELAQVTARLRASGYDIRVALRALFATNAFWAPANRGALVKSPVDLVVGTMRQFEFEIGDPMPLAVVTAQLGQNLFAPPNVKGWPGGEAWINSQTLLARKQFAERVFRADEMRSVAMREPRAGGVDAKAASDARAIRARRCRHPLRRRPLGGRPRHDRRGAPGPAATTGQPGSRDGGHARARAGARARSGLSAQVGGAHASTRLSRVVGRGSGSLLARAETRASGARGAIREPPRARRVEGRQRWVEHRRAAF